MMIELAAFPSLPVTPAHPRSIAADFDDVLPEIATLDPTSLVTVSFDVMRAGITVIAATHRLRPMRGQLARLPDFDLAQFDRLETYARAMMHAHVLYRSTVAPREQLPELFARGVVLRKALVSSLAALAAKGLVPAHFAEGFDRQGYRGMLDDLTGLVARYDSVWAAIEGRMPIEPSDIAEAAALGVAIFDELAARRREKPALVAASDTRQRAVTLLARAYYGEARWGVAYLGRHHGDAEQIAPSIYNRSKFARRARASEREEPEPKR